MAHEQFGPDEARRRIEVLSKLPETPERRRELAALRRALEIAATNPPRAKRAPSRRASSRSVERPVPYAERKPSKPEREVQRTAEGRKKVIIRRKPPEKPETEDKAKEERERRERRSNMRNLLGMDHRGMS
ncbi:MAG: hypothetical protein GF331_20225 [Chitinivibrionales bacterium]|nr:hypothetical protein [Chitinivibrionales bacterium]